MARVLAVGNAVLDFIQTVDHYPAEDEELRALAYERRRGGNAANTLAVLQQLGHACHWCGSLGEDADSDWILAELVRQRVKPYCVCRRGDGRAPVSHIILNRQSGSRTIVHHRALAELHTHELQAIDVGAFDWIHFEGRNTEALSRFLPTCAKHSPRPVLSLEVEKSRRDLDRLYPWVDVLFFAGAFARAEGYEDGEAFVRAHGAAQRCALTWGAQGCYGRQAGQAVFFIQGRTPPRVVDTVAAGDVFIAGAIDAALRGLGWHQCLTAANELAARKCARTGLDGLAASPSP